MNQLQNLLHDALISTDHVQHCAIVRRKDCVVRASSVGFNVRVFKEIIMKEIGWCIHRQTYHISFFFRKSKSPVDLYSEKHEILT